MLIGFQGHIFYSTHRLFIGECLLIDIFLVYEYVFLTQKRCIFFVCQKCHFLTCKYVVGGIFLIALRDQSVVIVCPCSLVNHQSINIAALILSMQMMIFVDRQVCLILNLHLVGFRTHRGNLYVSTNFPNLLCIPVDLPKK